MTLNNVLEKFIGWYACESCQEKEPDTTDLIVPISYCATRQGLTAATRENFLLAIHYAKQFPNAVIAFSNAGYVFEGATEIESSQKRQILKKASIPDTSVLETGQTSNSIQEAQAIRRGLGERGRMPRRILIITGAMHAPSARLIWRTAFPEAEIFIRCIPYRMETQKDHPVAVQRSTPIWFAANIVRHILILIFGLGITRRFRHHVPSKWPKKTPDLTDEQKAIKDDFMKYWHEVSPQKYSLYDRFNRKYPIRNSPPGGRVLEIGAGLGEQIAQENLDITEYHALELLPEMAAEIRQRFPRVHVIVGDCQKRLDFPDAFFDRVQAVHVLEHLPDLPAAIREVRRVLKPDGVFSAVIPCESGLMHRIARFISAERIFKKRYGMDYGWCIRSEHINMPDEIAEELNRHFTVVKRTFFPLLIPSLHLNLAIGITLRKKTA